MASTAAPGCPVHSEFDPLAPDYLQDPFAVMRELPAREEPVFYAPAIDYYVVTRYDDIEAIFLDHETFSAAAAQLPLAALSRQAGELLLGAATARRRRWSASTRPSTRACAGTPRARSRRGAWPRCRTRSARR